MLPHGSVGIGVSIPVAATQLVAAVSFTSCCTAVRYQCVSYASPVVVVVEQCAMTSSKDEYAEEDTPPTNVTRTQRNKT